MLETSILDQVRSVFQQLESHYSFHITYDPKHEQAQELVEFLKDVNRIPPVNTWNSAMMNTRASTIPY